MYFVYTLYSLKDKHFYIGYTGNIDRRIKEHRKGSNISTKYRRPLVLVHYEAYISRYDARRRERYFKTAKGKSSLRQMVRKSVDTIMRE